MISFFETSLNALSVHRVGNKLQDEGCSFSEVPTEITEDQSGHLLSYFLSPFYKVNDLFSFHHPSDLGLNEVCSIAKTMFESGTHHESSQILAKLLYEVTNHPKIRGGELYVARFDGIQFQGELFDAIGIFKSESKETYLKINRVNDGFNMAFENDAINLSNLSKGCLILNTKADSGYRVLSLPEKSKDTSLWKDEYLTLKVVNDNYQQTNNLLAVFKNFVTDKLDEEFEISKADKIDLLNKSIKYFKEKESFDLDEFSHEVINSAEGIELFKTYKKDYEEEYDQISPDSFDISDAGVKKQTRAMKSVLKLDKNFQINILGHKDLIEKGFDEDKALNYYKVYFKEEV